MLYRMCAQVLENKQKFSASVFNNRKKKIPKYEYFQPLCVQHGNKAKHENLMGVMNNHILYMMYWF